MMIPAATAIEAGLDMLSKADPAIVADELKELHVADGVKVLDLAFPNGTPEFAKGYLLGLETVRFMFASGAFLSGADL